jgi:hypothetical protein
MVGNECFATDEGCVSAVGVSVAVNVPGLAVNGAKALVSNSFKSISFCFVGGGVADIVWMSKYLQCVTGIMMNHMHSFYCVIHLSFIWSGVSAQ